MGWTFTREERLLKAAPWANIPAIREKLIARALEVAPRYKNSTIQFQKGKRATLANLSTLHRQLTIIVREACPFDDRSGAAIYELTNYFFRKECWVEGAERSAIGSYIEDEMSA